MRETPPFALNPLDTTFVPPKPKNSVEDERVLALEADGRAIYTRKYDGYYVSAVVTGGRARLYTRGIARDITANFPHLVEELEGIRFPRGGSLFCAELVIDDRGSDNRELVSRIVLARPDAAAILQLEQGFAGLRVFNTLILGNEDVAPKTNAERLAIVREMITYRANKVLPAEVIKLPFAEAQKLVRKNKWEGLVIYDASKPTAYGIDAEGPDNPPRPNGCWKWKPTSEDDFIAIGWEKGSNGGKHENRMGKLQLAQIHPVTCAQIPCGEVGTGFSDKERDIFANDRMYPCVVQVEYERRFAPRAMSRGRVQTALCNPRFVRIRDDKPARHCLLPPELAAAVQSFTKK
ncbi:MAG: hypothetical protein HY457_01030 [Parcubacteria group bacterium]|nr:hypothetical protein [Parcubacteria group bacterium]